MYRTVLGICVITLDFDDFGMDDLGVALVIHTRFDIDFNFIVLILLLSSVQSYLREVTLNFDDPFRMLCHADWSAADINSDRCCVFAFRPDVSTVACLCNSEAHPTLQMFCLAFCAISYHHRQHPFITHKAARIH